MSPWQPAFPTKRESLCLHIGEVLHWRVHRLTDTFPAMRIFLAAATFALATVLRALDVAPFPTWYYVFTWYPTLIIVDTIAVARDGKPSLFGSPLRVISILGWSAVVWLIYEAINLRIANWYYVFLPPSLGWRWLGIVISFGTVVPAVILAERFLDSIGIGAAWKPHRVTVRPGHLQFAQLLGLMLLGLPLVWPALFSPLVWGAGLLIADPQVYRLRKSGSLIADIEAGRWNRIGRLMLGGIAIGLWWEALNYWARGKWVYTVPFLEQIKLFEMPPLGFVGFPVFALSAWALYQLLWALGVAVPIHGDGEDGGGRRGTEGPTGRGRARVAVAVIAAVGFSILTLSAMERHTISSTVPILSDLPEADAFVLETLAAASIRSPFQMAEQDPTALASATELPIGTAVSLVQSARLATLRGIGTVHLRTLRRSGITSVCALASAHPDDVWQQAHASSGESTSRPTEPEVRVWIRAAVRACGDRG